MNFKILIRKKNSEKHGESIASIALSWIKNWWFLYRVRTIVKQGSIIIAVLTIVDFEHGFPRSSGWRQRGTYFFVTVINGTQWEVNQPTESEFRFPTLQLVVRRTSYFFSWTKSLHERNFCHHSVNTPFN